MTLTCTNDFDVKYIKALIKLLHIYGFLVHHSMCFWISVWKFPLRPFAFLTGGLINIDGHSTSCLTVSNLASNRRFHRFVWPFLASVRLCQHSCAATVELKNVEHLKTEETNWLFSGIVGDYICCPVIWGFLYSSDIWSLLLWGVSKLCGRHVHCSDWMYEIKVQSFIASQVWKLRNQGRFPISLFVVRQFYMTAMGTERQT